MFLFEKSVYYRSLFIITVSLSINVHMGASIKNHVSSKSLVFTRQTFDFPGLSLVKKPSVMWVPVGTLSRCQSSFYSQLASWSWVQKNIFENFKYWRNSWFLPLVAWKKIKNIKNQFLFPPITMKITLHLLLVVASMPPTLVDACVFDVNKSYHWTQRIDYKIGIRIFVLQCVERNGWSEYFST